MVVVVFVIALLGYQRLLVKEIKLMFGFGKKKLYKVGYHIIVTHYTIVPARNAIQAIRKVQKYWTCANIISVKELEEC